jgi:lipoyl(octanoyl) transferase
MIVQWLGTVEYLAAWRLQEEIAGLVASGQMEDTLLLLEHPHTLTLGRSTNKRDLLATSSQLEQMSVAVHEVDRGGEITYHGPGQLVGYPIFDLTRRDRDLHVFLRLLESAIIDLIDELGVTAGRFPPHTGVWMGDRKVAAIGIKVRKWITTHGFALNVSTDLSHFQLIVPCGIRDYGVTSLAEEGLGGLKITSTLAATATIFRRTFEPNPSPDVTLVPTNEMIARNLSPESCEIWMAGRSL